MFSFHTDSKMNDLGEIVYGIPVLREISLALDWFGTLVWYWQVGVVVGGLFGLWLFTKLLGLIFSTSDQ